MLAFMELYDKTDNTKHGKFKLSHFDIGKLLKCAMDTDSDKVWRSKKCVGV